MFYIYIYASEPPTPSVEDPQLPKSNGGGREGGGSSQEHNRRLNRHPPSWIRLPEGPPRHPNLKQIS